VAQDNGAGKYIKVRYPNGYEALYAHLSAFNVRVGDRVSQKQVIGRTGNTGLSTGPHLHYGLKKGGKNINPATEKFPRGAALSSAEKAAFDEVIRKYQPLLMSSAPAKKTAELSTLVAEFEP
jgi:murein DD-endopeptidase MepM/ murein hydrolase activator NlpD